jgi:uncharacterized protein YqeY
LAAVKNAQIATEGEFTPEKEIDVLRKEAKKLKDAADQYVVANAQELADKELAQLEIINAYLPQLMSTEDVEKIVEAKTQESGATGPADMGKVMGLVMKELKGKADGTVVNEAVKKLLTK